MFKFDYGPNANATLIPGESVYKSTFDITLLSTNKFLFGTRLFITGKLGTQLWVKDACANVNFHALQNLYQPLLGQDTIEVLRIISV